MGQLINADSAAQPGLAGVGSTVANAALKLYDIFANERKRGDYLKQQKFSNQLASDQLYRGAQIKVQDMIAAGLHPTLAAGGSAATHGAKVGAADTDSQMPGSVFQNALLGRQLGMMDAQIDMTNAEADKIRKEADAIPRRITIDEGRFDMDKKSRVIQDASTRAGIAKSTLETSILRAERDYIRENGVKMPTKDKYMDYLERVVQNLIKLGSLTPGAARGVIQHLFPPPEPVFDVHKDEIQGLRNPSDILKFKPGVKYEHKGNNVWSPKK